MIQPSGGFALAWSRNLGTLFHQNDGEAFCRIFDGSRPKCVRVVVLRPAHHSRVAIAETHTTVDAKDLDRLVEFHSRGRSATSSASCPSVSGLMPPGASPNSRGCRSRGPCELPRPARTRYVPPVELASVVGVRVDREKRQCHQSPPIRSVLSSLCHVDSTHAGSTRTKRATKKARRSSPPDPRCQSACVGRHGVVLGSYVLTGVQCRGHESIIDVSGRVEHPRRHREP